MKKLEMGRDAAKKAAAGRAFFRCDAFVSEATAKNLKSKNAPQRRAAPGGREASMPAPAPSLRGRHLLVIFD